MKRTALLWVITVIVTLSSVLYQRWTGPTYPVKGTVTIKGQKIKYKLLRTYETVGDARMEIAVVDDKIAGEVRYRRFKSNDEWLTVPLAREGENLIVSIPQQPAAGKVMYQVSLIDSQGGKQVLSDEPVIIRYKGVVPRYILYPHILLMFVAMFLATRSGLEAIVKGGNAFKFTLWTCGLFLVGGMILGPIVQKFAFGEFWTGWPYGYDLTDNKTAIAFLLWVIALWRSRKAGKGRGWIIMASVVTLLVYLVPHSAFGSELDYTQTGQ